MLARIIFIQHYLYIDYLVIVFFFYNFAKFNEVKFGLRTESLVENHNFILGVDFPFSFQPRRVYMTKEASYS